MRPVATRRRMPADPDADLRRDLRPLPRLRHRAAGAHGRAWSACRTRLPPGLAAALLQASAKAGFVGGIADWFAVTALFRHPLGLPIPHTAIIPRQKARLGRALGRFVAGHVITPAEVSRVLGRLDFAAILARFLQDSRRRGRRRRRWPRCCRASSASVEDGRARRTMARLVPRLVGGPGAGGSSRARCAAWSPAGGTRRCSASCSGEMRSCWRASTTSCTVHRGEGARPGRPADRLGAGRAGGRPRAGRAARRDGAGRAGGQLDPRGVRRMGPPRDRPHGDRSGARRRDRPGDPPGRGARDDPGMAVGRVVAPAAGARGRRGQARRPHDGGDRGRAGQSRHAS